MSSKDIHRYDDMLDMPRFISKNRKHMSTYDRAAQFAAFDALEGYDEAMEETARTTDNEVSLGENEIEELNEKFKIIESHIKEKPEIEITYFEPDPYKDGGIYITKSINIRLIDMVRRIIIDTDKNKYEMDRIINIKSKLLNNFYSYIIG